MYIIPYLSFIFCNIRKIMRKGTSDTLSPLDFAPIRAYADGRKTTG